MRSASSYRGAKKKAAREAGIEFGKFNEHYKRSRMFAAHEMERKAINATPAEALAALAVIGSINTPAEARRKLGLWAASGGRKTPSSPALDQSELDAMNEAAAKAEPMPEEQVAKKVTLEDIDKALEKALTAWQTNGHVDPMELSAPFAARARQIGWVEGVEFAEANKK